MSLTVVKMPVIPQMGQGESQEVRIAMDSLRAFFKTLEGRGGVVTVQDLVNAGLVTNKSGVLVKK